MLLNNDTLAQLVVVHDDIKLKNDLFIIAALRLNKKDLEKVVQLLGLTDSDINQKRDLEVRAAETISSKSRTK